MEYRGRGAIIMNGLEHLGDSGSAPLGHFKLLKKLANPSIAVSAGQKPELAHVFFVDRPVRSWKAGYGNPIRQDSDFNGLSYLVGTVIHRVAKSLFNGGKRIVEKPIGFRPIRMLDYLFFDHHRTDMS